MRSASRRASRRRPPSPIRAIRSILTRFRLLAALGFRFARRGGAPEYPYEEGNGFAYEPGRDHPLLLPSPAMPAPAWTLENLKRGDRPGDQGQDRDHPVSRRA